jgi:hypothetical protein
MFFIVIFFTLIASFSVIADEIPPSEIAIDGTLDFSIVKSNGDLEIRQTIDMSKHMEGVLECSIHLLSEDDFYNNYAGYFQLKTLPNGIVVSILRISSKYIDENGRYWNKKIEKAHLSISEYSSDSGWISETINDEYVLMAMNIESGLNFFHQITLGQPLKVEIVKTHLPKLVTITYKPVDAKLSNMMRVCMKSVVGDTGA